MSQLENGLRLFAKRFDTIQDAVSAFLSRNNYIESREADGWFGMTNLTGVWQIPKVGATRQALFETIDCRITTTRPENAYLEDSDLVIRVRKEP